MPFAPGDIPTAGDLASGPNTYTPQLIAVTDPTLGDGAVAEGTWYRLFPDVVRVWGRIRFGTSNVNPGSGFYRITMPTAARTLNDGGVIAVSQTIGGGQLRDNSAPAFQTAAAFLRSLDGGPNGEALVYLQRAEAGVVTDSRPWIWAASDAIAFYCTYLISDTV